VKQSSLIAQAAISTLGVLVQGLARFGYAVLIGRFMGPSDLAQVSAWLSLALILSLLWPTGAGNAASHFLAHARALGYTPVHALRLIQRTFWISSGIMLGIGIPIAMIGLGASPSGAVAVAALIVAYSGYILARGIEIGLGRITSAAVWDIISSATTLTLLTVVLISQLSWALLWPITIGYAVFGVRTWLRSHRGHSHLKPESIVDTREILRLTSWNSVGLIASNGLIQIAMVFVFLVAPSPAAGLFAAAMSLATPASMLSQAVSQVLIPRFSHWTAVDGVAAHKNYLKALAVMVAALAAVFGTISFASQLIVEMVFGSEYAPAGSTMALLLVGVFVFSIGLVAAAYLLTTGRARTSTVFSVVGLIVGLVVMIVGVQFWAGGTAAALGVIAGYAVTTLAVVGVSLKRPTGPQARSGAREPLPGAVGHRQLQ